MSATTSSASSSIARAHVREMQPGDFIEMYVQQNRPVILEGALIEWKSPETSAGTGLSAWTISTLQHLIGTYAVKNVFIASAQHRRRFKYFKAEGDGGGALVKQQASAEHTVSAAAATPVPAAQQEESFEVKERRSAPDGLGRCAMTFNEFVEKSNTAVLSTDQNAPAYYVKQPHGQRTNLRAGFEADSFALSSYV